MIQLRRIAFFIYTFSINFEILDLSGGGFFSVTKLSAIFYLMTVLGDLNNILSIKSFKRIVMPVLVLFLLITVMTIIYMNHGDGSLVNIPLLLNLCFLIVMVNHAKFDSTIMESGMISFFLGAFLISLFHYFNIGVSYEGGRVSVFGDNENAIGVKQVMSILIAVYFIIKNLNKKKYGLSILLVACIPLMFDLVLETGSRKAILGLFLGLFVAMSFLKVKSLKMKIMVFVSFLLIISFAYDLILNSEVLIRRLTNTVENGDVAGRDRIWMAILPLILEHPFLGVGESGFYRYSVETFGAYNSPHNVLIEILSYSGVVGLLLYLVFLYRIARIGIKDLLRFKDWLGIVLFMQILGFIIAGQALNSKIAWFVFAYMIANHKKLSEKQVP